jgi:UDP-N-acetylmuramoyl-tripeptide--D-alanyl-D-alanine ligase
MDLSRLYDLYQQHPLVQTDTRKLQNGCLFFALRGERFDGNAYAKQALQEGAAYAVVDDQALQAEPGMIWVPDVLTTLQALARYHRQQLDIPFLAITGSNGKTTTKELIYAVLSKKYRTYATIGNLNNHIGIPLTLLGIAADAEMAVIEMGANHQKEIEGYCQIALPSHGMITNVGKAHIEGFGGPEGVRKGKGELFDYLREAGGTVFINSELAYLVEMSAGIPHIVSFGGLSSDYPGILLSGKVMLEVAVTRPGSELRIQTKLVGDYNYGNVMAAVAIGLHFGVQIEDIKDAIEHYSPDNNRSQLVTIGSNKVIMDSYNANPNSMAAAIQNFASLDGLSAKKHLWIGGMKEMGADEQKEHDALIQLIRQYAWQEVVLIGPEFRNLAPEYDWYLTSEEGAAKVKAHTPTNAAILIKGSRGSRMELMADALKNA